MHSLKEQAAHELKANLKVYDHLGYVAGQKFIWPVGSVEQK